MLEKQKQTFYKENKMKYVVNKKKELLNWLKNITKKGYYAFIDVDDLLNLVNDIAIWYELEYLGLDIDFEELDTSKQIIDFKEFEEIFSEKALRLIKCDYRSDSGKIVKDIYDDNGNIVDRKSYIYLWFESILNGHNTFDCIEEDDGFVIIADAVTGVIVRDSSYKLQNIKVNKGVSLEALLMFFEKYCSGKLNFINLEKCIYNHKCDMILRGKVLQLVALELLYYDKDNFNQGYKMAVRFIEDINEYFDLNIPTDEIDTVMNRYYYQHHIPKVRQSKIYKVRRKPNLIKY